MIDIIKWHDASKELPTESGDYLVKLIRPACYGKSTNAYYSLPYSARWRMFNAYDHISADKVAKTAIDNVGWWASVDDIETRNEEVMLNEQV